MTVVVQASSGNRLAAKKGIAVEIVAEFFQEAEDVGDATHSWQGQGVLLLVKVSWTGDAGDGSNSGQYIYIYISVGK